MNTTSASDTRHRPGLDSRVALEVTRSEMAPATSGRAPFAT